MAKKPLSKIYVDGSNVFYTQKDLGWSLDWKKVRDYIKSRYNVADFRYYTGIKEDDDKMRKYLKYLDKIGFIVITKPVKIIKISKDEKKRRNIEHNKIYKSDCDVEITTDILLDRANIDEIILFSGDRDFTYLVKKLKDVGKEVFVFSSRKQISWELKLEATRYFFLEDIKNKIMRKSSK